MNPNKQRFYRMVGQMIFILALLVAKGFWPQFSQFLESNRFVTPLFNFLIFYIVVMTLAGCLKLIYRWNSRLRGQAQSNVYHGINNITRVVVGLGVVVMIFSLFGIDPRTLLTSMSIVAAAIAIISKEFINDFLIGLNFSFSKNFEINDYVKLGEQRGRIMQIGILKVHLLNDDDDLVLIPNSKVYVGEIVNYTKRDLALLSIDFQLDIRSVGSIETLEQDLISSLDGFSEFIEPKSFNLKIVDMKKDYIDFKFQYRIKELDSKLQKMIRKRTVRQVFNNVAVRKTEEQN